MGLVGLGLEYVSDVCVEFVAEVVREALADAARDPDGFAPFTAVLNMDGTQRRSRYELGDDPEATLELARAELGGLDESARCVAVVWNGYARHVRGEREAVYVEVYELGRPCGHVVSQSYHRDRLGVSPYGQMSGELARTDPIVPPTVELARRHLGEWTDRCRADLRELVDQLWGDVRAFDEDPRTCAPLLEEWLSDLPFGDIDTEDATALLAPVARYLAEVLIRVHRGRWDVTFDGEDFTHIVVVDGNDGLGHQLDPFALVRECADAPLPPVSAILRHALDLVHR
jgi:hypothetical protein